MSRYSEYFLRGRSRVVQLELLELWHPNFLQTHRVVRNARAGVTATIDGAPQFFKYVPVKVELGGARDDLDQTVQIAFGDLGEILPEELKAVRAADGLQVRPTLRYWTFTSDDLTTPLVGPLVYQVEEFSFNDTGATFEARAPSLNLNSTGERYTLQRFPMLRSSL